MDDREQLMYLLEHYYKGDYDTNTFTDEFYRIYDLEMDYSLLSEMEHELMRKLSIIVGRYSPYEEDLKGSNLYFSEDDVKNEAANVYLKILNDRGK